MLEIEYTVEVPKDAGALMEEVAQCVCRLEGLSGVSAYVRVVDDPAIHAINREQRNVDRPTDVLSFPSVSYRSGTAKDNPSLLRREKDPETGLCFLGDIVISIDRARAQAEEFGHPLSRELGYLTAHAMLHLCGYDHMTDSDKTVMRAMEEKAMNALGLTRDADERLK